MPPRHALAGSAVWWSLVFSVLTLCAQFASDATSGWQFARATFEAGAWWQLATSQWVHFNFLHAAVNAAAMALMLVTFERLVDARLQLMALVGGYVGVALVVALDSTCSYYAGASGALHGLLAGNALALLAKRGAVPAGGALPQWLGWVVLWGVVIKLLAQRAAHDAALPDWLAIPAYYPAHEAGVLGGVIAVLLAMRWLCWRDAAPQGHTR
jgi:rhomboid family GlyGly-CTERM serine protease